MPSQTPDQSHDDPHSSLSSAKHATPFAVSLCDVHFRWPGTDCDTLDIERLTMVSGERLFIAGPSGSGKSTLLALMAGIVTPTKGSVSVNGTRLDLLSSAERDRFRGDHIGFIFQQFNLVPYLSIIENVLIPVRFSTRRRIRAAKAMTPRKQAEELLTRLDLAPSLWKTSVNHLSIGQQQRVAAARALIGEPELIIADEPTSALDFNRREGFLSLLLEACDQSQTSLIFVSHDEKLASFFPTIVSMAKLNRAHKEDA